MAGAGTADVTRPPIREVAPLHTVLPVVFAICAAFSNAVATVLQRKAALTVPASQGLRAGLIADLLHRPVWLAGILAVIGAAVCQALALATGPLTIVQPLFVLELPLTLIVASLLMHRRLPGKGWLAVTVVVAGLAVALAAASPAGNRTHVALDGWIPALAVCAGAVVALTVAGRPPPGGAARAGRRAPAPDQIGARGWGGARFPHTRARPPRPAPPRARAACLGAATAISYAVTAALMKAATHILDEQGLVGFLTAWQTYAFAATGVCALFLLENAMQAGPLVASQPALTLGDALVSFALGITLYEETIRSGWWLLPQLFGVALIAAGVFALARIPFTQSLVAPDEERETAAAP